MIPKHSYSDICDLLLKFQSGEDHVLTELEASDFQWSPLVAQRVLDRVSEALNQRLSLCQKNFLKVLVHRDGSGLALELGNLKSQLQTISRLTYLPLLPPDSAQQFQRMFAGICREIEESLKKNNTNLQVSFVSLLPQKDTLKNLPSSTMQEPTGLIRRAKNG